MLQEVAPVRNTVAAGRSLRASSSSFSAASPIFWGLPVPFFWERVSFPGGIYSGVGLERGEALTSNRRAAWDLEMLRAQGLNYLLVEVFRE